MSASVSSLDCPHFPMCSRLRSRAATALALAASVLSAAGADADGPLCLPDRNGDGHPLFGNLAVRTTPELTAGDVNAVAFADLDHDGDLDAVVVHSNNPFLVESSAMTVLLNDGDGVFALHGLYRTAPDANHVALADLNSDGHVDAAITCGLDDERVFMFLQASAGKFAPPIVLTVGKEPSCVRAADVDCDGDLDLITLNQGSDDVSLLRNEGGATFAPEVRFPAGSVPSSPGGLIEQPGPHLDAGDLDGDGDVDLAVPNGNKVFLLLNDGSGGFTPAMKHLETGATYVVAIGDLNNDGRNDVATSSKKSPDLWSMAVFLNESEVSVDPPTLAFGEPARYPFVPGYDSVPFGSIAIGDVTGDGFADIVAAPFWLYEGVSLYRNQGDGTFAPKAYEASDAPEFIPFIKDSYFAALADVNGDGWLDLNVLSPWGRSTMRTVLNDGAGNLLNDYRSPHSLASFCTGEQCFQQWDGTDAGDIDGDGDIDLVVAQSNMEHSSRVKVLFNDGSGKFPRIDSYTLEPLTEYGGNAVALVDLNADGAPDIVYVDSHFDQPGRIWTMMNLGDGSFARSVKYALSDASPRQFGIGDFDGDGDIDLALWIIQPYVGEGVPYEPSVLVLSNNGTGGLSEAQKLVFSNSGWYASGGVLDVGDLNNDGWADLVVCERAWKKPSLLAVLLNDGRGRLTVAASYVSQEGLNQVRLADLDSDGNLDVFGSYTNAFIPTQTYLRVWRNDGTGRLTEFVAVEDPQSNGAPNLAVGDIDGDGVPDAVTGGYFGTVAINLAVLSGVAPQRYGTDAGSGSLCIADFDGDGRMDVSATNYLYGHVSIMLNRSCPRPPPACKARPSSP